jgi:riboflavin synthase
MFTGIIETTGKITEVVATGGNKYFWVESPIAQELKIDQSLSHNGVCLTVEAIKQSMHKITAIEETLKKSTLDTWKAGDEINLERCMLLNGRLDGHIVQGHVDTTALCTERKALNGSWEFTFEYPEKFAPLLIEKGSVTVNGTSLTCFNLKKNTFAVAIIPYTFEHTSIRHVNVGSLVNIEFDILGKYIDRLKSCGTIGQ